METLEINSTQLDQQNSVGAADILSPVDTPIDANPSIGSSIQETELGQSLTAALDNAAPVLDNSANAVATTDSAEPAIADNSVANTATVSDPASAAVVSEPAAEPIVIPAPSSQEVAQESQALTQEQAPSPAEAPTVNTPVGDSADPTNNQPVADSLRLTTNESAAEALADIVPGIDPTTIEAPANPEIQGFSVEAAPAVTDDHDHGNPGTAPQFHVSLDDLAGTKGVNSGATRFVRDLTRRFGSKGDLLDPGAGNNTVIGAGGNDLIFANKGGLNTITTGGGSDTIVLGDETTNRIFDFNPDRDRFILSDDLDINNIVIAQGKNPGKGGLNQPLDSVNNTLIVDKSDGHVLASLNFVKSDAITDRNFFRVGATALEDARNSVFSNTQEGSGQLTGGTGRDKLISGDGDDFLAPGDDTFQLRTARSGAEFPFANDSPGTTRLNLDLKGGVLKVNGTYKDYDGAPLFSQGETAIDPSAIILNGSNPQALIDGFLKVPQDVEGNKLSGTHLHFSPSGDARGNFADATVVRYFTNTPTSAKAGTITGEFELTPQEQAALLGGNLYVNAHTNVDTDKDGKGGFPTGENRINLNKNVVRFV
jgi:RTX calcium-binding nonapeptide repeat (4 copies)